MVKSVVRMAVCRRTNGVNSGRKNCLKSCNLGAIVGGQTNRDSQTLQHKN